MQQEQRGRLPETKSLADRLADECIRLRKEARGIPPGIERDRLLRRARQAETGSRISGWRLPGK
jgi:hypothetical protein